MLYYVDSHLQRLTRNDFVRGVIEGIGYRLKYHAQSKSIPLKTEDTNDYAVAKISG